jgi:hypothetical protein
MSRLHILVFVFAFTVLLFQPVDAADFVPVEVDIEPQFIKTDLQMPAIFSLNVKNNQNFVEELRIAIEGPHIHWVTNPAVLLIVPKNSTKEVSLTFYPVEYRGVFDFDIVTSSHKSLLELDRKNITIFIPPPIVAENFSVSRDGSTVTASIDVETIKERVIDLTTEMLNQGGDTISTTKESHRIKGKVALTCGRANPHGRKNREARG